jgi:hypothetical protein
MNDNNSTLEEFLAKVKSTQTLWALQDKDSEDWVVLDSIAYENTEVMPTWSNIELAKQHCIDEWANYIPCEISLSDWFEFWIEDLNQDGVIVGVDWQDDKEYLEMELADFTQKLSTVESLK